MNTKLTKQQRIQIAQQQQGGQRQKALAQQYDVSVPTVRSAAAYYRRQLAVVKAAHERALARHSMKEAAS